MPRKLANLSYPDIFTYVDYRAYLSDYFNARKKNERGFTYRSLAAQAGVAPSLLKDILNNRQNLSLAVMKKYAGAMKLGIKEMAYFEALVLFNNGKTNEEKNRYLNRIVQLRGRSTVAFLDTMQYEYFATWYNPVVRELACSAELKGDPKAIAARIRPKVTAFQVKKAIALLEKLGLIIKNGAGNWQCTDKVISSEYEIQSVALKNYHAAMLGLAREGLNQWSSDKREYQTMALHASKAMMKQLKARMRTFTDEILAMVAAEEQNPDEVFQLGMYLFPYTDRESES